MLGPILMLSAVLAACSGGSVEDTTGLLISPEAVGGDARAAGELVLEDGCFFVAFTEDQRSAIIWPKGTTRSGDSVSVGDSTVTIGDQVDGGGAFFEPPSSLPPTYPSIPADCDVESVVVLDEIKAGA